MSDLDRAVPIVENPVLFEKTLDILAHILGQNHFLRLRVMLRIERLDERLAHRDIFNTIQNAAHVQDADHANPDADFDT